MNAFRMHIKYYVLLNSFNNQIIAKQIILHRNIDFMKNVNYMKIE